MKVIIEEGDVGELAPGVYDVKITSTGSERNYWPAGSFGRPEEIPISHKLCLGIDIDLKQKPTKRHWFNADQHLEEYALADVAVTQALQAGAAMAVSSQLPNEVDLQVGATKYRLKVGDVIEQSGSHVFWTIIGFPSATTWRGTASTSGANYTCDLSSLASDLEKGSKTVRPRGSTTTPVLPDTIYLQVGPKFVLLSVGDVIEGAGGVNWTVLGFPSTTSWKGRSSFNGKEYTSSLSNLSYDLRKGIMKLRSKTVAQPKTDELVVGTQLKWAGDSNTYTVYEIEKDIHGDRDKDLIRISWPNSRSTPGLATSTYSRGALMGLIAQGNVARITVTCDKSRADCKKHGNLPNFGGVTNHATARRAPCPHTFGSKTCGVGWNNTAVDKSRQWWDAHKKEKGWPEGYGEGSREQMEGRQHRVGSDCDECYGTGLYKGFGGPCPKGCTGGA